MSASKTAYRGITYLLILSFLFTLVGPALAQEEPGQPPAPESGVTAQRPPAPPDEDMPGVIEVDSSFLLSPSRAPALSTVVGGFWVPQGPGPAYNGQVEGINNKEVVGAIHAIAPHPTNPDILYIGAANGGIWRTDNARSASPTWVPLTDQYPSLSIGALEFDPTDPTHNTLVAGIGRYSSMAQAGGPRAGLMRSIDGGASWQVIPGGPGGVSLIGKNISGVAPRGNVIVVSVNYAEPFWCNNIGLFRSVDTGATFVQVGPPGVAFDLAGDPLNPQDLYTALTFASGCSGGTWSNGVYHSADGGVTWTKISNATMDALIVDGTTNNVEIAARGGNILVNIVQNGQSVGVFYRPSGSSTWSQMDQPLIPDSYRGTIANVTPGSPIQVTTASSHGLTTGDVVEITGVNGTTGANGIHTITVINSTTFSLDGTSDFNPYTGGGSWRQLGKIANVTPGTPIQITTSAAHNLASGDQVQISGVGGTTGANGIHTITVVDSYNFTLNGSSDSSAYTGGGIWEKLVGANPKVKPGGQGGLHASLAIDPITPTIVYLGGDRQDSPFPNYIGARDFSGSLFRGNVTTPPAGTAPSPQWDHLTHADNIATIPNGGTAGSSAPHADSREMVFDANGDIIESDDGGVYRRTNPRNNTGDWYSLNGNLQVTEMHSVAYDNLSNIIISGNQDTGTTYQLAPDSTIWTSLSTGDGGDVVVDNILLAASDQSVRYSSYQNLGGFFRSVWDADGNLVSWTNPSLTVTGGGSPFQPQFYTPLATNAVAGNRLLIGGWNSLYESLDGGNTITEIGPGLRVSSGGDTIAYGGMQSGTPNPDVFYVAAGPNVAVRTTAGGPIATYPISGTVPVVGVAMDPTDWKVAYAILSRHVFSTTNAGVTWTNVTTPLMETNLRSIAAAPGMLFVGGGTGVYVMDTASGKWYRFGQGLPHAPVWDLDYDDQDHVLIAGTLGRGAWKISTELGGIDVTKSAGASTVNVGEMITYTYYITNTGSVSLTLEVKDGTLGPVSVGMNPLPPGAVTSGTLTYVVVEQDLPGPLTNTVTATGTYTILGGGVVTDTDWASVALTSNPSITVTKLVTPTTANVGKVVTYTYLVTNTGDVTLSSVVAVDDKLGSVTLVSTTLAPGASTGGVLTYTVTEGDLPGPLTNTVTVTGTPPVGNDVTAEDDASVALTSNPAITVTKLVTPTTANIGEVVTYTYLVTNTGDVTLDPVVAVDDKLGTVTLGATSLAPGASTGGILTYTITALDLPGPLTNTVIVTGTAPGGSDVTAWATATVTLNPYFRIYLPLIMLNQ